MNGSSDLEKLGSGTRVLITGGAGFVGSRLSEVLIARGCSVTVLDDLSTGNRGNVASLVNEPGFRLIQDDVTSVAAVEPLVAESDLVVHLAAAVGVDLILADPLKALESNIFGSQVVLETAHRQGAKVLLASSSEIYGKSLAVPFSEGDDRLLGPTYNARWSYSTSKAVGEHLGLAYHEHRGVPVCIFRLFNTIGPRQTGRYGMVVPRFVEQAVAGRPLTVYGDGLQSRSFCDVDDAVRAIVALAEAPQAVGEVVNIGSPDEISILELARKVLSIVARTSALGAGEGQNDIVLVPYDEAYPSGFEDMRRRVPNVEKHRRLTGWEPEISLDQSLERIIEHYRRRAGSSASR